MKREDAEIDEAEMIVKRRRDEAAGIESGSTDLRR